MAYTAEQIENRKKIPGLNQPVMEGSQKQRPTSGKDTQPMVQQKPGGPDTPEVYGPTTAEVAGGHRGPYAADLFREAREGYKGVDYGYDPYQQDRAGFFQEQDFNPYREATAAQTDAQRAQQEQGAYSALLGDGPASASDRMALASNFNRQRITGALGAGHEANQRQNQGEMRTGQQNIARGMAVDTANAAAQTQMARQRAIAEDVRRQNLYRDELEERLLNKKLAASADIARSGSKQGQSVFDQIGRFIGLG